MSLDPYVRLFVPRLSPFTTAVASGTLHIAGQLTDVDRLRVEGTVETADLRLFDYALRNAAPIRMALHGRAVEIQDLQLVGEDTRLRVSGTIGLSDERIALRAVGDANLGILQGFFRDVRGSGRADLIGGRRRPAAAAGVFGPGHDQWRPDPPLLPAEFARCDQWGDPVRFERHSPRRAHGHAGRRARAVRRPDWLQRLRARRSECSHEWRQHPAAVSGRGAVGRGCRSERPGQLQGSGSGGNGDGPKRGLHAPYRGTRSARSVFPARAKHGGGASAEPVVAAVPLRFDIEIIVPSTFRVDNNIARLVANADFFLRGTYDRPSWFGHADVERGDIQLLGRRYQVTKGSIDLVNPTRIRAAIRRGSRNQRAGARTDLPRDGQRGRHAGATEFFVDARIPRCPRRMS